MQHTKQEEKKTIEKLNVEYRLTNNE